jgi:hypothetical protein
MTLYLVAGTLRTPEHKDRPATRLVEAANSYAAAHVFRSRYEVRPEGEPRTQVLNVEVQALVCDAEVLK